MVAGHRIISLLVLASFVVLILPRRRHKCVVISRKAIYTTMALWPIPIGVYAHTVATANRLLVVDWIGLSLMLPGLMLVYAARGALGKHHAWAGYYPDLPGLVTRGVYSFVRHPLYIGIYAFMLGGLLSIIAHEPWFLSVAALGALAYPVFFLGQVAVREESFMASQFGKAFAEYRRQVHAFLPLRRYRAKHLGQ